MSQTPTFSSPAQAITVMFNILARLSGLVMWLLIGLVHLTALVIALATCWALGVTADDVQKAYLHMLQTTPGVVLTFLGLSAGSVLAGWVWLLKKLHKAAGGSWLIEYLLKGTD